MTLENNWQRSTPKWVNPCGLPEENPGDPNGERLSDNELLQLIITQSKIALSHAKDFCDDFVQKTFNVDLESFHQSWKGNRYTWLPTEDQIPKSFGQNLDQTFLDQVKLDVVLPYAYEYLQKFAVGLEQIAWDQKDLGLAFFHHFAEAEVQLRKVLCEIQVALIEKGIPMRADVGRHVMPNCLRSMTERTDLNLRDWLIFRDYMNGLEFVIQVFEYLLSKLEV